MKTMMKLTLPLFVLFLSPALFANSSTETFELKGIRQQAMGGVRVITTGGAAALLSNPANLAYSRFKITLPRISADLNQDTLDRNSELEDLMDETLNDDERKALLLDLAPMEIAFKQRISPGLSFATKGFAAGLFVESSIFATLDQSSDDVELSLEGYTDVVPALGFAQEVTLFNTPTALGISAKFVSRYRIYDTSTGDNEFTADLNDLLRILGNQDNKKKMKTVDLKGVGFDLGFLRPLNSSRLGQGRWGVTVQNIGATLSGTKSRIDSDNVETEEDYEEELMLTSTFGIGFENRYLRRSLGALLGTTRYALDYTFITEEEDFRKKLNLGIEQDLFGKFLKLRGGISDGYVSGGVGLDIYIFKLPIIHVNYANYTEEMGEKTGEIPIQYQAIEVGILF